MNEHELQPWVVTIDGSQVALWQLSQPAAVALALFSDQAKADAYAHSLVGRSCNVIHPSQRELLGLMIQCFQQQIVYAVLDPTETQASRIFQLREVLKAARGG